MLEKCHPFHIGRSRNASVASTSTLTSPLFSPDTSSSQTPASTPPIVPISLPKLATVLGSPRANVLPIRQTRSADHRHATSGRIGKSRFRPRGFSSPLRPPYGTSSPAIRTTLPSVDHYSSLSEPATPIDTRAASSSLGTIADASRQRTRSVRIADTCANIRHVCVLLRPVVATFPGVKLAVELVGGILKLVEARSRLVILSRRASLTEASFRMCIVPMQHC